MNTQILSRRCGQIDQTNQRGGDVHINTLITFKTCCSFCFITVICWPSLFFYWLTTLSVWSNGRTRWPTLCGSRGSCGRRRGTPCWSGSGGRGSRVWRGWRRSSQDTKPSRSHWPGLKHVTHLHHDAMCLLFLLVFLDLVVEPSNLFNKTRNFENLKGCTVNLQLRTNAVRTTVMCRDTKCYNNLLRTIT